MMKYRYVAFSVIFLAGNAVAAGIELSKDAVSVSSPDLQGQVVIAGAPGCVVGPPPIYISARNKKNGMAVNSSALPNGGFQLRIPARGEDSVKLTFIAANGKKKDLTVKVPEAAGEIREGAVAKNPRRSEVNVDLGQFSQFGAPEVVQVKHDGEGGTIVHVGDRPPQGPAYVERGMQVFTRGPVHEAFAEPVVFNTEPGIAAPKAPPAPIEEVPPEQRPEGANVAWIPGYWAWDDEGNDFIWVSGIWRAMPPDRQWVPGYWGRSPQGYQWTSGYWADAATSEVEYLSEPPETVEAGPNIAAPSADYTWVPGCWVWYQGRYAWRPGYWAAVQPDWDWVPAHYVWTPRGYVFVDGYWDYTVNRRGVLFAPVHFDGDVYRQRGFFYSPSTVIDLAVFIDQLFLRPHSSHYYFGDYYAASYQDMGFYPWYSFNSSRYGYDPIYAHQRWEHRHDREWEHRLQAEFQHRRDHENARPPRTLAAQRGLSTSAVKSKEKSLVLATSLDQLAKRKGSPMRFQPLAKEERQRLAQHGQEVQKFREERKTLETKAPHPSAETRSKGSEPARVRLSKSPIVAKSAAQLGKGQAPPKRHEVPKPDPKVEPKSKKAGDKHESQRGGAEREVQR